LGSLFSSDDRKARQAADKENGAPPPPDPEYKAVADQNKKMEKAQKIIQERASKRAKSNKQYNDAKEKIKARQSQNQGGKQLAGGSRVGQGSASSGVTGSIWAYQGKNISGQSIPSAHTATAKDYAAAKKFGRGTGFYQAGVESKKAGEAKDADTAAASAIDAFQKGITDEELKKDEEETGLDELPEGINEDFRDDLARDLSDDVNDQNNNGDGDNGDNPTDDYTINENCIDNRGNPVWNCFLMKGLGSLLDAGTSYLSWAAQGGLSNQKMERARLKWCMEHGGTSNLCGGNNNRYNNNSSSKKD